MTEQPLDQTDEEEENPSHDTVISGVDESLFSSAAQAPAGAEGDNERLAAEQREVSQMATGALGAFIRRRRSF